VRCSAADLTIRRRWRYWWCGPCARGYGRRRWRCGPCGGRWGWRRGRWRRRGRQCARAWGGGGRHCGGWRGRSGRKRAARRWRSVRELVVQHDRQGLHGLLFLALGQARGMRKNVRGWAAAFLLGLEGSEAGLALVDSHQSDAKCVLRLVAVRGLDDAVDRGSAEHTGCGEGRSDAPRIATVAARGGSGRAEEHRVRDVDDFRAGRRRAVEVRELFVSVRRPVDEKKGAALAQEAQDEDANPPRARDHAAW
jgi:hypothetical protein